MRKNKSLVLTVLLCCLFALCTGLIACGKSKEVKLNVIESDDGYEWTYNQAFVDDMDADVKIDGKLDEARWNESGKKWLTHVEKDVRMRYTTSFSEKGLYIAAEAKDAKMQWNDTRAFMNNSSFFFYIISNKATEYHAFDCMGFYVDELHSACRQGSRFAAKGLRTVDADGVPTLTAEFFASWKSLNYTVDPDTGMPESADFVPAYRYVEAVASNENTFLKPALAELGGNRVDNAYAFDGDGYINVDVAGAELGNGANGFAKSDGWDLTQVLGDADGNGKKIAATTEGDQAIFFKNIQSSRYSYEVTMTYNESIAAGFPAMGVLDMKNANDFNILRFHGGDITGSGNNYRYFLLDFHNGRSDVQRGNFIAPTADTKTIKVRVIKDDAKYYYILNDAYAFGVDLNWLGGKTVPGLYTYDAKVEFTDWEATDYEGSDKDEAFATLCARYMYTVNVAIGITGGTIAVDKLAVDKASQEEARLTITPARGYVLSELTLNGQSVYDDFVSKMENGVVTFVPSSATLIGATFSAMPQGSTVRITGTAKRSSGAVNIGLPYTVREKNGTNKILYTAGVTTGAGVFDMTLLKAGSHTLGNKTVTTDGIYTLTFEGKYPAGEQNVITLDTATMDGGFHAYGDVTLNPIRVTNMTVNADDTIRTTHTQYDASETFCYYVTNDTVQGTFQLDMTVTATNDKWPCYGFTIEDDNNNALQLFAAGVNVYRIMSSYDGVNYKQYENMPATFVNGVSQLKLVYNEKTDEFKFYVNGKLFGTLNRGDYLTGKVFRYGPVGYMSGADGSNRPVTESDPFATFTQPKVTKEFTVTVPQGATVTTADGVTVTNGKVPVLSSVTVTYGKNADEYFTAYVNGTPVATVNEATTATATFDIEQDSEVAFVKSSAVRGTVKKGTAYADLSAAENLTDVRISVTNEDGKVVFTTKADASGNFTVMLPDGTFYIGASGKKLVSNALAVTVDGSTQDAIELTLDKPALSEQLFATALSYDAKTGDYLSNYAHGQKAGGYLAGAKAEANESWAISTKLKDLGTEWPSGGFAIGTSQDKYVKFEIVKADDGTYILRIKDAMTNGEALWWFRSIEAFKQYNSLTEFTFTAVCHGGNYYLFLNDDLLVSVSENMQIGGTTIKSAIGSGKAVKLGLYGEARITFTEWRYTLKVEDVKRLIGKTITANGMTVTANGAPITDGNVLLGDEVTVSIDVPQGQTYNILVDGNVVATENKDGKATATFTVTDDHTVTYLTAYAVSGSVTNGDENTVITIASENGGAVYTGKGTTFATHLVNGTYVVTAQNANTVSAGMKFTVDGAAVGNISVTLAKAKLTAQLKAEWPLIAYDVATGYYKVTDENSYNNGGYFADITAADTFVLKATIREFTGSWPSAGFAVQTANGFVRFAIRWRPENDWKCYDSLSWNSAGQNTDRGKLAASPFVNGSAEIMLVYNGGTYYFFVNGVQVFSESGYDTPSGGVGLFCERNITYTDWQYSAAYNDVNSVIGKTLTASGFEVSVNGTLTTNSSVLLGDAVTVSMAVTSGQTVSILVDGLAVETKIADGKATATFKVTDDHTVTYVVSYAVRGTVTGGDENSAIHIVTESGNTVYTGKGTSFSVNLPNGVYYASAKTDAKMSKGVQFTVVNAAVENIALTIEQPKINHYAFINQWGGWTWNMVGTYEDGKSVYHIPNHDYWAGVFDGGTFAKSADYVVKANCNLVRDTPDDGTVVGLALYSTTADDADNVKFEIVYGGGAYFLRVRGNNQGGFVKNFNKDNTTWVADNQNALKHNVSMAVVHKEGGYYVFINDTLVLSLTGNDANDINNAIKTDNLQVGVYAEFESTYAEWSYSGDVSGYTIP